MKTTYSALFRIIPHYSALFRIILVVLTVINAENSNGQTSSDNSSNSDALTISLYSGIGDVNLGGLIGIETEWMYRNASIDFGVGRGNDTTTAFDYYNYRYKADYTGNSMGIKVYDSDANSKNRIFGGINRIKYYLDNYYYKTYSDITFTACYRHTANNEIYISPYAGIRLKDNPVCYGLNVGYQFKPIHLK